MAIWTSEYVLSPTEARTYKDFLFESNNLTSLSSDIEILGKVLSIVKLVNGNITHYLIKLSKDVNLLVSIVTSFFISGIMSRLSLMTYLEARIIEYII